jgi:cysteine-rich repeat protein
VSLLATVASAQAQPLPLRPIDSVQIGGDLAVPVPVSGFTFWFDDFGAATAAIGDLDGDDTVDAVVGAPMGDDLSTGAGAAVVLFLEPDGGVEGARVIDASGGTGNLTAALEVGDRFGSALASIADLDGDGIRELAVGAPGDDEAAADAGAVYVLFLNRDGTVRSEKRLTLLDVGLSGAGLAGAEFGSAVAAVPILGAGLAQIAVGAPGGNDSHGAVWVLAVDSNGDVVASSALRADDDAIAPNPPRGVRFGASVTAPDDVDGNGVADLLVGAPLYIGPTTPPSIVGPGTVWLILRNPQGGILSSVRIGEDGGGFPAGLPGNAGFGTAATSLGDIDGNAITDVAVTAPGQRAVWFLLLNASGAVIGVRRIDDSSFSPVRPGPVGTAVSLLGDLDGNGIDDILVGGNLDYEGFPSTTTTTFFCPTTTSLTTTTTLVETLEAQVCALRVEQGVRPVQQRSDVTIASCSFPNGFDKCDRPKQRRCGGEHVLAIFLDLEADPAVCGNGRIDAGEACDDGNTEPLDCCTSDCLVAPLGNECAADNNPCGGYECDGHGACVFVPASGQCSDFFGCVDDGTCSAGSCVAPGVPQDLCRVEDGSCRSCGQPVSLASGAPSVSDALWILQSSLSLVPCLDCVCDVDGSGAVVASDALFALFRAVGLGNIVSLRCPHR